MIEVPADSVYKKFKRFLDGSKRFDLTIVPKGCLKFCTKVKGMVTIDPHTAKDNEMMQKFAVLYNKNAEFVFDAEAIDDHYSIGLMKKAELIAGISFVPFYVQEELFIVINVFRVDREYRRQGHGTMLFNMVKEIAVHYHKSMKFSNVIFLVGSSIKYKSHAFFTELGLVAASDSKLLCLTPADTTLMQYKLVRHEHNEEEKKESGAKSTTSKRISDSLSQISSVSSAKGKARHCIVTGCDPKAIPIGNWARHWKTKHPHGGKAEEGANYIQCTLDEKCTQYHPIEKKKSASEKNFYHCLNCGRPRRSDELMNLICKTKSTCIAEKNKRQYSSSVMAMSENSYSVNGADVEDGGVYQEPEESEFKIPSKRQKTDSVIDQFPPAMQNSFKCSKESSVNSEDARMTSGADQTALSKLQDIVANVSNVFMQVAQLEEICVFLSGDLILDYLQSSQHTVLQDVFEKLLIMAGVLAQDKLVSLCVAVTTLGGSSWLKLSGTIKALDVSKRQTLLEHLALHYKRRFGESISQWLVGNWQFFDETTMVVAKALKTSSLECDTISKLMTIARAVQVPQLQVNDFIQYTLMFLQCCHSELVIKNIVQAETQPKISLAVFQELSFALMSLENTEVIAAHSAELIQLQLKQWLDSMALMREKVQIVDSNGVQNVIDRLIQVNGAVGQGFAYDLHATVRNYKFAFQAGSLGPNDLQFAVSQYAIGALYSKNRQIWVIPSGQGKSRVAATMAMIALLQGVVTKVHLVFENAYLMERDRNYFANCWEFLSFEEKVQYHSNIEFECDERDLVIIDEGDALMFDNPAKLSAFLMRNHCICLTATPDNCEAQGVDVEVASSMSFIKLWYPIDQGNHNDKELIDSIEEVQLDTVDAIVQYVGAAVLNNPVLMYGTIELKQQLKERQVQFVDVDQDIDTQLCCSLEKRTKDGYFNLVLSTNKSGMRGVDYRAKNARIDLLIAAPFDNKTEMKQGLHRVGRYGDACKRFIVKGVQLFDSKKQLLRDKNLYNYITSVSKIVQSKPAPLMSLKPKHPKPKKVVNGEDACQIGKGAKAQDDQQAQKEIKSTLGANRVQQLLISYSATAQRKGSK